MQQEFIGDLAQPFGQLAGEFLGVGAGIFAIDRTHRVDVLIDQLGRNAVGSGRVLDQPAKAVGRGRHRRIAEGGGFALDIVGGVEQRLFVGVGEAVDARSRGALCRAARIRNPSSDANSGESSASAFSARATGSSLPASDGSFDTALRSLFSGVMISWSP